MQALLSPPWSVQRDLHMMHKRCKCRLHTYGHILVKARGRRTHGRSSWLTPVSLNPKKIKPQKPLWA